MENGVFKLTNLGSLGAAFMLGTILSEPTNFAHVTGIIAAYGDKWFLFSTLILFFFVKFGYMYLSKTVPNVEQKNATVDTERRIAELDGLISRALELRNKNEKDGPEYRKYDAISIVFLKSQKTIKDSMSKGVYVPLTQNIDLENI